MNASTPKVAACLVVVATAICLTSGATSVAAQGTQTKAPPAAPAASAQRPDSAARPGAADSTRKDTARAATPNVTLAERLIYTNGRPLSDAVVTLTNAGLRVAVRRVDTSDASGSYRIDSLAKGEYTVLVAARGGQLVRRHVSLASSINREVVLPIDPPDDTPNWREMTLTALFIILYFNTIAFVRWHNIARSVNELLQRQLLALELRAQTEVGDAETPQLKKLRDVLGELCKELRAPVSKLRPIDFLLWSRGRENALWAQLHEIERQLAAFLAPPEQVEVYLRTTQAELRRLNSPTSLAIADAVADSLKLTEPIEPQALRRFNLARQALLGRALSLLFMDRDEKFASLMEWQNKAGWLIFAALLIVMFLTVAAGHAILFLAGAAGGLLSRLARTLKREDLPLDYGASWTTLFLSPVLGALTGWFGVALITLLTDDRVSLLGPAFKLVDWTHPRAPWTIVIAFLLGFSERLFDSIVAVLETSPDQSKAKGPASPATATPAVATAGSNGNAAAAAAGAAAIGPPTIISASLELRATGAPRDVLAIIGRNFDTKAMVLVNGDSRPAKVESTQRITIDATTDDLQRISIGGDFDVIVKNANGAASLPFSFTAVLTP